MRLLGTNRSMNGEKETGHDCFFGLKIFVDICALQRIATVNHSSIQKSSIGFITQLLRLQLALFFSNLIAYMSVRETCRFPLAVRHSAFDSRIRVHSHFDSQGKHIVRKPAGRTVWRSPLHPIINPKPLICNLAYVTIPPTRIDPGSRPDQGGSSVLRRRRVRNVPY